MKRAAVFIDQGGFSPVLKPYYKALQTLLGGLFQTAFFHDRVFNKAPVPNPSNHYLSFRGKDLSRRYDLLIYQSAGGDPSYLHTYGHLYPGVAIYCGDYLTSGLTSGHETRRAAFRLEMERQYGREGRRVLKVLKDGHPRRFFKRHFPLYPSFLEKAPGIITYTDFEKRRIEERFSGKPVIRMPWPVSPRGVEARAPGIFQRAGA